MGKVNEFWTFYTEKNPKNSWKRVFSSGYYMGKIQGIGPAQGFLSHPWLRHFWESIKHTDRNCMKPLQWITPKPLQKKWDYNSKGCTVFRASQVTFFPVNRVEHQKLNQPAAEPPSGWVFDVQLGLRQTRVTYQYLTHYHHLASFW